MTTAEGGVASEVPIAPAQSKAGWRDARRLLRGALRLLVTGQSLGQAGDSFAQLAVAQLVLFEVDQGATPGEIATYLAVTLLPFSVIGPFAGVIIDRWPRRSVLVVASFARIGIGALGVVAVAWRSELLAYALLLLLLSSSRFVLAAKGAALPATVRPEELVPANAISGLAGMTSAFLAAVLAAAVIAWATSAGFVVAVILYLLGLMSFRRLPDVGGGEQRVTYREALRRGGADLVEGARSVFVDARVRRPLYAVWAHRLLLGAGFIILLLVADAKYGFEVSGYALGLGVSGLASFIGSVGAPVLAQHYRAEKLLPLAFLLPVPAVLVAAFVMNLGTLLLALAVASWAFQTLKVLVDAMVGKAAANAVRGRVFAAYDLFYNVAFVLAALLMIPLWEFDRAEVLIAWQALAFFFAWGIFAWTGNDWPFSRVRARRGSAKETGKRRQASKGQPEQANDQAMTAQARADACVLPPGEAPGTLLGPFAVEDVACDGAAGVVARLLQGRVWSGRLAAFFSGALLLFSFPEPGFWWLAWVGLVPLLLLVQSSPTGREGAVRAWWGGVGFLVLSHFWLVPQLGPFLLVFGVLLALPFLFWGAAVRALLSPPYQARRFWVACALIPSGWVVLETIRSWEYLGGPWGLLGASQWSYRPTLAAASLGGVWLVSLLVLLANTGIVLALSGGSRALRVMAVCVSLAAFFVGPAWHFLRGEAEVVDEVNVALVQPGAKLGEEGRFARGEELTATLQGQGVDLVVWGESSVGFDLENEPLFLSRLTELSRDVGAAILVNVDARRPGEDGIRKSSVLVDAEGVRGRYDKMRLVPFGEYIPMRGLLGWITAFSDAADEDRHRGAEHVLLHLNGHKLGPLVCFESAFPDQSRALVVMGADFLVVQSNTNTFQETWAPEQHASIAAVRAVETGRSVVHSTLTGESAAFSPSGRNLLRITTNETGVGVFSLPVVTGRTLYNRMGAWVPPLCFVLLFFGLLGAGLQATRFPVQATPVDSGAAAFANEDTNEDTNG